MRNEFLDSIAATGMFTLKDLRKLTPASEVPEFSVIELQGFDEEKFAKASAERFGMTFIDLRTAKVPADTINAIKKKFITEFRCLPVQNTPNKITLATFDPSMSKSHEHVAKVLKRNCEIILTTVSAWKKLFSLATESVDDLIGNIVEVKGGEVDSGDVSESDINDDVVTFVNRVLAEAFVKKVSDIHVEPYEKIFRIRYRKDGTLVEAHRPPKSMLAPVVSRLKIMAELDISEKRKPQDGRIKLKVGDKPIDYRVSCLPTLFGEKVVLRLLDQSNLQLDMTKLGFEEKQLANFQEGIHRPFGMVLVTGPTGSGKTTTLYSALSEINNPRKNISTAEDPVEFNLEGINQVNVRKDIGFTFAAALKSFLRQDPDIIMVGEIRDLEVGEIAVEAALTGHLVLSTLHTNDAPATITRLLNMGIEPFLVTASLNVVVAQRLCRKICTSCRAPHQVAKEELVACGVSPASAEKMKVFKGTGCEVCNGTGYKGRVAIYEVLPVSAAIRELIIQGASSDQIKLQAIREGMKTLRMSALTKVAQGLTTIEEAVSNSASDAF